MKSEFLTAAAFLLATTATAQPITPSEAEDILASYGATLTSSGAAGDTAYAIDAQINDLNMTLRLGGCNETDQCGYVMMFATFDLGATADTATFEKTNSYNDRYPFGRAFVLKNDQAEGSDAVGVDYVVDLSAEAVLDGSDISQFETILNSYIAYWTAPVQQ